MAKKKERTGIVLRNDQMICAERVLNDEELGKLYTALRAYAMEGKTPKLEGMREAWCVLFDIMRAAQDDAISKYEETCERNRASSLKRWQNECARIQVDSNDANIIENNKNKESKGKEGNGRFPYGQAEEDDDDGYWLN